MNLRKLQAKDAQHMLEWMHDVSIVQNLNTDFASKTIRDCLSFIEGAQNTKDNIHLAIVDENDEYMGTVSLKHIGRTSAEFGIAIRKCAMGKGFSSFGMAKIIAYGKEQLGLDKIYWCVNPNNARALRFYDKHQYHRIDVPDEAKEYSEEEKTRFIWYKA